MKRLIVLLLCLPVSAQVINPSGGGSSSGGGGFVSNGLLADYTFRDGSGTNVSDISGNNNSGTFVSGKNPVWTSTGLQFTVPPQGVSLPSALNTARTFEYGVYIAPISQTGISQNAFPVIANNTQGGQFVNMGIWSNLDVAGLSPANFYTGGFGTSTSNQYMLSGFHVVTYVLGTSGSDKDHFYVDGIETPYTLQNFAWPSHPTTGNYNLGSDGTSPYGSSGFIGTMYRVRVFSVALTQAQAAQDSAAIYQDVQSRGVTTSPQPFTNSPLGRLIAIGDSITCAYDGSTTCNPAFSWFAGLSLVGTFPTVTSVNLALFNANLRGLSGSARQREATYCPSTAGPGIAIVFAGSNDLGTQTPANVLQYMSSEIAALKTAGCRVLVGTMISRTTEDTAKNNWNALLVNQAKAIGADGIIDFGANVNMGADGANTNATYFQADHIHPTATGQAQLAQVASNSLNYYFGSQSPNTVTTNTYQMLSSDRVVTAAPTASAAWTAPSCLGPSGETYTIINSQSAQTLTIVGQASQPINGLTSAITLANNTTHYLTAQPNVRSTAGCSWSLN